MKTNHIFSEGKALSFDGMGEDGRGFVFDLLRRLKSGPDLIKIMAVDFNHVPAESFHFFLVGRRIETLGDRAGRLQAVQIEYRAEAAQFVDAGGHEGFPYLAFRQLAVAQAAVYAGRQMSDGEVNIERFLPVPVVMMAVDA